MVRLSFVMDTTIEKNPAGSPHPVSHGLSLRRNPIAADKKINQIFRKKNQI